jgi:hypothetical protein
MNEKQEDSRREARTSERRSRHVVMAGETINLREEKQLCRYGKGCSKK